MVDANFSKSDSANATESGGGTVGIVLRNVDFQASSATTGNMQGYIELVVVWEWTPQASQGIVASAKAPPSFTVQEALAKITSVGEFLMGSAAKAVTADLRGSLLGGAVQMGMGLLTRPALRERRAPALMY
jgi:hypothetical protein